MEKQTCMIQIQPQTLCEGRRFYIGLWAARKSQPHLFQIPRSVDLKMSLTDTDPRSQVDQMGFSAYLRFEEYD